MKLEGRTALVTGASKGIGRAIALAFGREGAAVAVTGRTASELDSLKSEIEAAGGRATTIVADLSERAAVEQVHAAATAAFGDIDILVNNAGMGSSQNLKPVIDFDDAFWDTMLFVNLTAPYLLCKKVLPAMVAKGRGRVINVSSINGKIGALHGAAYAASKHGLLGLTRTMAIELTGKGVTTNAICPGPVATQMNDRRIQADAKRLGKPLAELEKGLTLLGRRLVPDEIAPLAVYLASDDSSGMTGQAINVDGGVLMTG
ncbi:MAG: SDR family oxidoreductase [Burkholderiaceae bacterium]|nr:SDR family oxidoreductase [Burkholderiaceae bacterium]